MASLEDSSEAPGVPLLSPRQPQLILRPAEVLGRHPGDLWDIGYSIHVYTFFQESSRIIRIFHQYTFYDIIILILLLLLYDVESGLLMNDDEWLWIFQDPGILAHLCCAQLFSWWQPMDQSRCFHRFWGDDKAVGTLDRWWASRLPDWCRLRLWDFRCHHYGWKKSCSWEVRKLIWVWINTYENTIFSGMNIHLQYQLFWCSPGVQGFDTLPCCWCWNGTTAYNSKDGLQTLLQGADATAAWHEWSEVAVKPKTAWCTICL